MNNPFNMALPNFNFMNQNLQGERLNNSNKKSSENIFPYIQGERKEIIFFNSKKENNIVKIPVSLKDEIYSIAEKYKSSKHYEIKQLLHNNKILEKVDSSIDFILNGDSIKIIEF